MPSQFDALSPFELMLLYRGDAIGSYGNFEQTLARCFIVLTETKPQIGSLIFFKIVNTRSRLAIMNDLLKEKVFPGQKKFWISAFKLIREIDRTRNKIVHWLPVLELPVDKNGVASVDQRKSKQTWLQPPDYWRPAVGDNKPLAVNDVLAFRHKTEFLNANLNFWHMRMTDFTSDAVKTFEHRFQQPIPYPPPKDHPLYEPVPVWKNQPRSSQA